MTMGKVVNQTNARVFGGDTHVECKILSVFETSTEVIRKGKASKPTEFGKLVKVQEAENQIVIDYTVYDEKPSDTDRLIPSIESHQKRLGRVLDKQHHRNRDRLHDSRQRDWNTQRTGIGRVSGGAVRRPALREEGAPGSDDERVGDHGGADASGLIAGAAAEPAKGPGDDHPFPVGEMAEPEMHGAEEDAGDDQGGSAAPGPLFDPLLQHTAEEELFGEGEAEQEAEEVSDQFERVGGRHHVRCFEEQDDGDADGKVVEIV